MTESWNADTYVLTPLNSKNIDTYIICDVSLVALNFDKFFTFLIGKY
jgi:hypothetical protein